MSMFPHTVTLYNAGLDNVTNMAVYNITILRGVFLDISKGANVMQSGLTSADAATLYIPMSIEAINGKTGQPQTFIAPKEYARLEPDETANFWTLRSGGSASSVTCFFAKGEIVEEASFQAINSEYDDVYRVTTVDTKDFGSKSMQHWEVGGS